MNYVKSQILRSFSQEEYSKLNPFDWELILLLSYLVNIDNQFSFFEERKIGKVFQKFFTNNRGEFALKCIKKTKTTGLNLLEVCKSINTKISINERPQIIQFLLSVASSDANLSDEELDCINFLSKHFGISQYQFFQLLHPHRLWNIKFRDRESEKINESVQLSKENKILRSKTVLGLLPNASKEDIKKQYRLLIKKYHPDLHPNLSPTELIHYREQIFRINEAYEYLIKLNV